MEKTIQEGRKVKRIRRMPKIKQVVFQLIMQRKTVLIFFILYFLSQTVSAAIIRTLTLPDKPVKTIRFSRKAVVTPDYLLLSSAANNLSVTQYQQLSGKKLSLKNKISYLFIKHELKAKGTHSKTLAGLEGFALGLFLGPIGVLIAYLTSKDKRLRTWSVIGGVVSVFLFIFLLAAIVSAFQGITFDFI